MSTKPYGARYTRREFRNNKAPKGLLAFRNETEGEELFLSPAEAQSLMNVETARVASARATGNAKRAEAARAAAARAEAAAIAKAKAEAATRATTNDRSSAEAGATASAAANGRSSSAASPFSQGSAAAYQPPRGSNSMATLVSKFSGLSLRPPRANPIAKYATDIDKTEVRATLTARITGQYSVTTQSTMGQGDCMYSSVYRAAISQGFRCVVDSILSGYNKPMPANIKTASKAAKSQEEMEFVQKARFLVSDEVTGEVEELYNAMVDNFENNKIVYDEMIGENTTFVRETARLIKKYIGDAPNHTLRVANKANFIRDYKNNIVNLVEGNIPSGRIYSGELENNALIRIIERMCKINIVTVTSELRTQQLQVQPNTIYIENQGGGHYVYFAIGDKVPDRDPTYDEIVTRAKKFLPTDIITAIVKESGRNLDRTINKIVEVYGGKPFGLNIQLNTNFSNEYLRLKTGRAVAPTPASAAKPPPKPSATKPTGMSLRSSSMTRNAKIAQLMAKGASNIQAGFALNASANNVSQAETLLKLQGVKLSGGKRTRHKRKTKRRLH